MGWVSRSDVVQVLACDEQTTSERSEPIGRRHRQASPERRLPFEWCPSHTGGVTVTLRRSSMKPDRRGDADVGTRTRGASGGIDTPRGSSSSSPPKASGGGQSGGGHHPGGDALRNEDDGRPPVPPSSHEPEPSRGGVGPPPGGRRGGGARGGTSSGGTSPVSGLRRSLNGLREGGLALPPISRFGAR